MKRLPQFLLLIVGLSLTSAARAEKGLIVSIGYVPGIESRLVAEIAARLIEKTGDARVVTRSFAGPEPALKAVESGDVALAALASGTPEEAGAETLKLEKRKLTARALGGDRPFVLLVRMGDRDDLERSWTVLETMGSRLTPDVMRHLADLVQSRGHSIQEAAEIFIGSSQWISLAERRKNAVERPRPGLVEDYLRQTSGYWRRLGRMTGEHSLLVFGSLALALLAGLPLGLIGARRTRVAEIVTATAAVFQTIPSLALICFLIPFTGMGPAPALGGLFLLSTLMVARSLINGLTSLDPVWIDSARVMGLNSWALLWRVQLPLALPSLMTGIRAAAVTSVATATVAALLGAGGYGSLIVAGLALNDVATVLRGALPAALFAMMVNWAIELGGWMVLPRGLK